MFRAISVLALTGSLFLAACNDQTAEANDVQLHGEEWKIEDIGGKGVVDNSPAALTFAEDGSLSGNASCNMLSASYTVEGEKLSIGVGAVTRRACVPALMEQENRLLDALGTVETYGFDDTGALILTSADGAQIIARR